MSFDENTAKCRIAGRRLLGHTVAHNGDGIYQDLRVSSDTKARVNAEAQRQLLTESVWLRRAIDAALRSTPVSEHALIHRAGIRTVARET